MQEREVPLASDIPELYCGTQPKLRCKQRLAAYWLIKANAIDFSNDAELSTLSLAADVDLFIDADLLQTNGSMNIR